MCRDAGFSRFTVHDFQDPADLYYEARAEPGERGPGAFHLGVYTSRRQCVLQWARYRFSHRDTAMADPPACSRPPRMALTMVASSVAEDVPHLLGSTGEPLQVSADLVFRDARADRNQENACADARADPAGASPGWSGAAGFRSSCHGACPCMPLRMVINLGPTTWYFLRITILLCLVKGVV